jgi:hypothetical protein
VVVETEIMVETLVATLVETKIMVETLVATLVETKIMVEIRVVLAKWNVKRLHAQ